MNEHVLIAARRLDEPVALRRIEPLDGAFLHRLSPQSFHLSAKTREAAAAQRVQMLRSAPQARFWGKFRNDCVANTASTGWPKSDCLQSKPGKCGASMAATRRTLAPKRRSIKHRNDRLLHDACDYILAATEYPRCRNRRGKPGSLWTGWCLAARAGLSFGQHDVSPEPARGYD
jgi:hypothetical protein